LVDKRHPALSGGESVRIFLTVVKMDCPTITHLPIVSVFVAKLGELVVETPFSIATIAIIESVIDSPLRHQCAAWCL
jgi:hypothetical protein